MATRTLLEDLYTIPDGSYTTGSEWVDGFIIGLATLLLIRNAELVVIDILTFFFGNRPHRVGYRVLRTWQMLTMNHFYSLLVGSDHDIPTNRLRKPSTLKRAIFSKAKFKISKGRFAKWLFLSVFLGKLFVLGAEVAIIAVVIPVEKAHRSSGGLGIRWKNVTFTQDSLTNLPTCLQLLSSNKLANSAQITLCKRTEDLEGGDSLPSKWIPDGSLRLETVYLTHDVAKKIGGIVNEDSSVLCHEELDQDSFDRWNGISNYINNDGSIARKPRLSMVNSVDIGELKIMGFSGMDADGNFAFGAGAIQPIFSDPEKTLRLAFADFLASEAYAIGEMAPAINGKLLFSGGFVEHPVARERSFCPLALEEIIRITGSMDAGLLIDVIRSSMDAVVRDNFTEPSRQFEMLNTDKGFQIGTSRKYRLQPEWMIVVAGVTVVLTILTARLNETEARMARVYRENNNMWSACSPVYLNEEMTVDSALFQNGDVYHWGDNPGEEWEERDVIDSSREVDLR